MLLQYTIGCLTTLSTAQIIIKFRNL